MYIFVFLLIYIFCLNGYYFVLVICLEWFMNYVEFVDSKILFFYKLFDIILSVKFNVLIICRVFEGDMIFSIFFCVVK